jgi:hypothetical protein
MEYSVPTSRSTNSPGGSFRCTFKTTFPFNEFPATIAVVRVEQIRW